MFRRPPRRPRPDRAGPLGAGPRHRRGACPRHHLRHRPRTPSTARQTLRASARKARSRSSDPALAANPYTINDFSYAGDPDGLRCPGGAYIRRANPRDSIGFFDGRLTNRHRVIRRGRPYGPKLQADALEDDGQDRGLIFVCFNADIWRQFETIQALWIDDGDPSDWVPTRTS